MAMDVIRWILIGEVVSSLAVTAVVTVVSIALGIYGVIKSKRDEHRD